MKLKIDKTIIDAINDIERTPVSEIDISSCSSEYDFTALGVSLLVETGSYVCISTNILGENGKWDRDTATIGGSMVRLYKLVSAMLDQTVQRRRETSFIFARLIFETVVNTRYLIRNFSPDLVDSFIRHSFKHERRLRKKILDNIDARKGLILPIEDRMLKSIDRSFVSAGLSDSDMEGKNEKNWGGKNLFEKADALGLGEAYLGAFSGPSHAVHGAWFEIYSHNLETSGDLQFEPNLEWQHPRPQLIFATSKLTITAIDDFFDFVTADISSREIKIRLENLFERIATADAGHENYLSSKKWPSI